jgi:hypothetical protein
MRFSVGRSSAAAWLQRVAAFSPAKDHPWRNGTQLALQLSTAIIGQPRAQQELRAFPAETQLRGQYQLFKRTPKVADPTLLCRAEQTRS